MARYLWDTTLGASEPAVELVQIEPHVGRASVWIAVRPGRREQPVHERLHLGLIERIPGAHRRVAGMGASQVVERVVGQRDAERPHPALGIDDGELEEDPDLIGLERPAQPDDQPIVLPADADG